MMLRLAALLLAVATAGTGAALDEEPEYLIRTWGANEGVREGTINEISQTTDGYLWFSNYGGLGRFDGTRFRFYDRDNTPELGSRMIGAMVADSWGRLWAHNAKGEFVVHDRGTFRSVAPLDADDPWIGIEEIDGSTLWLLTARGHTHAWVNGLMQRDEGLRFGIPLGAYLRSDGAADRRWFWMTSTNPSRLRLHGHVRGGEFHPVTAADGVLETNPERYANRRGGGRWIFSREQGVATLRALLPDGTIGAGRALPRDFPDLVTSVAEDAGGAFWMATRTGLVRVGTNNVVRNFTARDGLPGDVVRVVFVDAEDNVWAGSEGGGVCRVSRRTFSVVGRELGIIQAVWAGKAGELRLATHGLGVQTRRDGTFGREPGVEPFALSLHVDAQGGLWAGELTGGLSHVSNGVPLQVSKGARIRAIVDDGAGGLWAGGLQLLRVRNQVAQPEPGWACPFEITSLALDRERGLWIGTAGEGLHYLREGRYTRFTRREGLAHDEVAALYLDGEGTLWIGTYAGGVSRWKNGAFTTITAAHGLADDALCGIGEDGLGNFWFSSVGGIFRVPRTALEEFCAGGRREFTSFAYNQNDGLANVSTVRGSQPKIARDDSGRMWFATSLGAATVDPARLPDDPEPYPVVIEDVTLDSVRLPDAGARGWRLGAELSVAPGARRLEIAYTSPSFRAPEKIRHRYRLEGRDQDWTDVGGTRSVAFDRLPPGRYRLQVQAANANRVWSRTGEDFAFVIQPFFWQTTWFRAVVALLVLAGVAGGARELAQRKYRRRLAELERQQAVDAERARIARDMHDDVGASLTRITMLGARVRQDLAEPARATAHLQQLREVSREMAGKLDELVWVVNPRNDNAAGLAEYLSHYAEQFFRAAQIPCRFDIPPGLPGAPLAAEARHEVFLAFKEALNNVVKHASATEARFTVGMEPGTMVLVIEDNGRGFDAVAMAATGDGLRNLRERLLAIGGACLIDSQPGQGTRVTLRVPVANAGSAPS